MTGRKGAALLALACGLASWLGACGGNVDSDPGAGGAGNGAGAGGTGLAGSGGGGASGAAGAAGEAGMPPRLDAGVFDCNQLSESECGIWADQCVPVLRNDQLAPGVPPTPVAIEPDPCCIGCESPACVACHNPPRFVGCRDKSACNQTPEQLCGYLPSGVCP